MKYFKKNEALGVGAILLIIVGLTLYNFRISIRRSRDTQRRADLGAIADALYAYQKDFGFFPPSTNDGKILACKGDNFGDIPPDVNESDRVEYFFTMLRGCDWGDDGLRDVEDDSYKPYLVSIPKDPKADTGYSYFYISNKTRYQIYASLEGGSAEVGYREGIAARNLKCGNYICNFGKAFGETPLEKSIEEYENELGDILKAES